MGGGFPVEVRAATAIALTRTLVMLPGRHRALRKATDDNEESVAMRGSSTACTIHSRAEWDTEEPPRAQRLRTRRAADPRSVRAAAEAYWVQETCPIASEA